MQINGERSSTHHFHKMNTTCPQFQEYTCAFSVLCLIFFFPRQKLVFLCACFLSLTKIFAKTPSSLDSMVTTALSVSISQRASPAATASPAEKHMRICFTTTVAADWMTSFTPWWSTTSFNCSEGDSTLVCTEDRDSNSTSTRLRRLGSAQLQISCIDNERILMWGQLQRKRQLVLRPAYPMRSPINVSLERMGDTETQWSSPIFRISVGFHGSNRRESLNILAYA